MKKSKIIFTILTTLVLLASSIGIYSCYDMIEKRYSAKLNFEDEHVINEIYSFVYCLAYQTSNYVKKDIVNYVVSDNELVQENFYASEIVYWQNRLQDLENIKFVVTNNNNYISSNTNDDLSKLPANDQMKSEYQWYIKMHFDETGTLTCDTLKNSNVNYSFAWNNYKEQIASNLRANDSNVILNNPTNYTFYFAVPKVLFNNDMDPFSQYSDYNSLSYEFENILPIVIVGTFVVCLYIFIYPYDIEKEIAIFKYTAKIKLGFLIVILGLAFTGIGVLLYSVILNTVNNFYVIDLINSGFTQSPEAIVALLNISLWLVAAILCMLTTFYIKMLFKEGLRFNTICGWLYTKAKQGIKAIADIDFSKNITKSIVKICVVNCLIMSVICLFFAFGIIGAIAYSIIIFLILRNKFDQIEHDYQVLFNALKRLSTGDFDVEIKEDIGYFNSLGNEFNNIKVGFEKAVNEEVKSQKMKTELISNVSHDLKTPLTSIITYIDLLKDENITPEQHQEYFNTLERNSLRLKNLIEDLFEVSKVNSGDVKLDIVDVDIVALLQQAKFELDDQFVEKNLTFKTNYPEDKVILALDSLKTYRIFENLLINISKYALANTRVYLDVLDEENQVTIMFKNISEAEIKLSERDLIERFVQGDTSRNTNGSGLGLAIAKSFTELQKGTFEINVDGDLFKAIVTFKKK